MRKILGIKIDNLGKREILQKIEFILSKKNKNCSQVVTINPEFVLEAQGNKKFREILNSRDTLNIADGIGLKFAAWRYGWHLKQRWAGVDLMMEILKIANENKQKVFLIANKNGLSSWRETAKSIKNIYPNLEIAGVNVGADALDNDLRRSASKAYNLKSYILNHKSSVVLCALGAPHQEVLLSKLDNLNIKLSGGVGGSFDFLTGQIKRVPKWMRIIGLEWFYRFIQEPRYRLKRIYRAIIIFPIKVIFNKRNNENRTKFNR